MTKYSTEIRKKYYMLTSSTKCNKCISENFWIAKSQFWKLLYRVLGPSKYTHGNTFGLSSALWDTQQMLRDLGSRYVFKCLPCVVHIAHGKTWNLPCVLFLPCVFLPSTRPSTRRVPFVCRVLLLGHTANDLFAVCPFSCSRQTWDTQQISVFP